MGFVIHAQRQPDGSFLYGEFYEPGRYATDEMTEEQLTMQLKYEAAWEAAQTYERMVAEIPKRLNRARANGTSEMLLGSGRNVDGPWDEEEREPPLAGPSDDDEDDSGGTPQVHALREEPR